MVLDVQVWFPWRKQQYLVTIMQPSICLSADIYKPIYLSIYLFIHPFLAIYLSTSATSAPLHSFSKILGHLSTWGPWWSNFRLWCWTSAPNLHQQRHAFFQPAFRSTTRSIHGIHLLNKKYWIKDEFLPGKHSLVINNKPGEIRVYLSFKTDLGRVTLESFGRCWWRGVRSCITLERRQDYSNVASITRSVRQKSGFDRLRCLSCPHALQARHTWFDSFVLQHVF